MKKVSIFDIMQGLTVVAMTASGKKLDYVDNGLFNFVVHFEDEEIFSRNTGNESGYDKEFESLILDLNEYLFGLRKNILYMTGLNLDIQEKYGKIDFHKDKLKGSFLLIMRRYLEYSFEGDY